MSIVGSGKTAVERPAAFVPESALGQEIIALDLVDSLRIAAGNSREYQARKQSLFLAALDFDLERFRFDTTFTGFVSALLSRDESEDQTGVEGTGGVGVGRTFATGADLSGRLVIDLVQAQADYDSARQEWDEEERELKEVKQQIAYCEVRAPAAGMVVYETSANQSRWGDDEPLEAGQEIRERQELIYLPSSDGMVADIAVHQSALTGLPSAAAPGSPLMPARAGSLKERSGELRRCPMPKASGSTPISPSTPLK